MRKFFGAMAFVMMIALLMTVGAIESEALGVLPGAIILVIELIGFGVGIKGSGAMIKR